MSDFIKMLKTSNNNTNLNVIVCQTYTPNFRNQIIKQTGVSGRPAKTERIWENFSRDVRDFEKENGRVREGIKGHFPKYVQAFTTQVTITCSLPSHNSSPSAPTGQTTGYCVSGGAVRISSGDFGETLQEKKGGLYKQNRRQTKHGKDDSELVLLRYLFFSTCLVCRWSLLLIPLKMEKKLISCILAS